MKKASFGFLLLMSAALLGAQTAVIRELTGRVEIKTPGTAEWETAAPGQELEKAALISTGFKSMALISIGNSIVTVRPLTRLSLEEITASQNDERVTLNLRAGRVHAEVKPPSGGSTNFTVRAPSATASVRGTIFEFDGTRLTVAEGRVRLSGQGITGAYVGKGHSTTAEAETGTTVSVIENLKGDLSPALPVGLDTAPTPPSPASAGLSIGFTWPEEK